MKKNLLFVLILTFGAVIGCGGKGLVPVGGKITYDDGSPVTSGGVAFQTATYMADGQIQPDGTYTLSSIKPGDGLPPGNYKVTIGSSETGPNESTIYLVDPKFGDREKTPLSVEVTKGGKNQFDFTVTKPEK